MAIATGEGKLAYLIYPYAETAHPINFEFGNGTQVFASCSLQFKNQYYVFGGFGNQTMMRQVSIVNGNRLERKGTLDFDFSLGGCTVLNQTTVVLCFGVYKEPSLCLHSNNPFGSFKNLPNSIYGHYGTRVASFDGRTNS